MIPCSVEPVYFQLQELYVEGKYSDVSIFVEEKTFKCHRIVLAGASSYFDAMFGGSFKESSMKECRLENVDAKLFEEVLRIIYSGKLEITSVNVFDLLRTSEFLSVPKIRDPCIKYVLANMNLIPNMIEIFVWARSVNILPLKEPLLVYISLEFVRFSESAAFLQMSFDDFNEVLVFSLASYSHVFLDPIKEDDFIMDAIIRWLHYSYAERIDYVEKFITMIPSMAFSAEYSEFLMREYKLNLTVPEKRVTVLKTHHECFSDHVSFSNHEFSTKKVSINLFLGDKIFSINKYKPDGFISHTRERSSKSDGIFVTQSSYKLDSLYCLGYEGTNNQRVKSISFYACSSLDLSMCSLQNLSPPPIADISYAGAIDERNNNIYYSSVHAGLHYSSDMRNANYLHSLNSKVFSDDEIATGMFRYNCELDEWYSVPQMRKSRQLKHPRLLCDKNLVFILYENGELHAYDTRSSVLLNLPKKTQVCPCCFFDCCVFDEKIYVVDGTKIEILDLTACKWETMTFDFDIENLDARSYKKYKMAVYDGKLWSFHNQYFEGHSYLSIHIFNPGTKKFSIPHHSLSGRTVLDKCAAGSLPNVLLDVVVSKC